MKESYRKYIDLLNAPKKEQRLEALKSVKKDLDKGVIVKPKTGNDTNNHIHTMYSFSPYSPTSAVFAAYMSGLCTAGIVDHDSIGGAREFIEAGKIIGITTTIGCELRVTVDGTMLEGLRLNNPDEVSSAYIALHGVPHTGIDSLNSFLADVRNARNTRNIEQIKRLNKLLPDNVQINFKEDVLPISFYEDGGSITERHILFALVKKIISNYGKGDNLIKFIQKTLNIDLNAKNVLYLKDTIFYAYEYDVLNILKSNFVPKFYIEKGADMLPVRKVVDFAKKIGAIPTYCYLGDVAASPTGDKKAQKFEDSELDRILEGVKDLGFEAIAYMPSRNTVAQLERVIKKCDELDLIQISGEDINQPRQGFICDMLHKPMFKHLVDSTWALVGHEYMTTSNIMDSIYGEKAKATYQYLRDRIRAYAKEGRKHCCEQ